MKETRELKKRLEFKDEDYKRLWQKWQDTKKDNEKQIADLTRKKDDEIEGE